MPREPRLYYGRLYGSFHDDLKRARVSLAADGLWVRALSRAIDKRTDGWVEDSWLRQQIPPRQRTALLAEVTRERLLEPLAAGEAREFVTVGSPLAGAPVRVGPFATDGWLVHDFLEHQFSQTQIASQREQAKRRAKDSRARRSSKVVAAVLARVAVTRTVRARHAWLCAYVTRTSREQWFNPKVKTLSMGGATKDRPARGRASAMRGAGAAVAPSHFPLISWEGGSQ